MIVSFRPRLLLCRCFCDSLLVPAGRGFVDDEEAIEIVWFWWGSGEEHFKFGRKCGVYGTYVQRQSLYLMHLMTSVKNSADMSVYGFLLAAYGRSLPVCLLLTDTFGSTAVAPLQVGTFRFHFTGSG